MLLLKDAALTLVKGAYFICEYNYTLSGSGEDAVCTDPVWAF